MSKENHCYPPIADKIIHELYRSAELLGADHQLLAFIGSWNSTLPDAMVLDGLRFWIKLKKADLKRKTNKASAGKKIQRKKVLKGSRK